MSGQVQEGDKVSWNWAGSNPSGTVGEVKAGEVTVASHRGNEISKTGDESNPAVHIERSGNNVVKTADELNIDKKAEPTTQNGKSSEETPAGDKLEEKSASKQVDAPQPAGENKKDEPMPDIEEAKAGDKRKAAEKVDTEAEKQQEENGEDKKKQKTNGTVATNGGKKEADKIDGEKEKKKPGRPKGSNTKPAKEKKEPTVGKAARKTRSQAAAEEKST